MYYLGIDLGGTNIKGAAVNPEGDILLECSRPTNAVRGPEAVTDDIAAVLEDLMSSCGRGSAVGVGIGCPGTVDDSSGVVLYSNNLDWHHYDLRGGIQRRIGLSPRLSNDANAAALGEVVAGCAKGAESAVILTLGTGVGSGIVLNGKLYTGFTGAAAELGHMVIVDEGEVCTCGRRGCFEAYASATALTRMTRDAMELHPESRLHEVFRQRGVIDGRTAFSAKALGDETGAEVVQTYIHYLATGITNIVNCFYPEVVALSGGIANQGDQLLEPLRREVYGQIFGGVRPEKCTEIICCTLGYRAGIIGAAMLNRESGHII